MHFICDKCTTKYSIPDSKIAGKILKLRCKKCGNTITIKDPDFRAVEIAKLKETIKKPDKGKELLKSAFKKSLKEDLKEDLKTSKVVSEKKIIPKQKSKVPKEEKTQNTKPPEFKKSITGAGQEEWYLADSRGQFGPMELSELIARIKRGEPDHDAVVWRDGFDEWLVFGKVPELKLYSKHLPPPRKTGAKSIPLPVLPSSHPAPMPVSPQYSGPVNVNPHGTGEFSYPVQQVNPQATGKFRYTNPNVVQNDQNLYMMQEKPSFWKDKISYIIGAGIALSLIFVFLAGKYIGASEDKQKKVLAQNNKVNIKNETPMKKKVKKSSDMIKKPVMKEVVYILSNTDDGTQDATDNNNSKITNDNNNDKNGSMDKTPSTMNPSMKIKSNGNNNKSEMVASNGKVKIRTKSMMTKVMRKKRSGIRRCYAIIVRKGQKDLVSDKIKFHLRIKPNGTVSRVSFTGDLAPYMRQCLIKNIKKWKFSRASKRSKFNFTFNFN
jgi:predicted Zn finger-like uncharacterized protein